MTKKISKEVLYTELKVLQAKIDKLTELLQEKKETEPLPAKFPKPIESSEEAWKRLTERAYERKCIWDSLPPEDRFKPQGISCPCPKCTPYCLSGGSLMDGGSGQVWMNTQFTERLNDPDPEE